jgi:hypothetical protein
MAFGTEPSASVVSGGGSAGRPRRWRASSLGPLGNTFEARASDSDAVASYKFAES